VAGTTGGTLLTIGELARLHGPEALTAGKPRYPRGSDKDGLDRVQAVLGLVEDDAGGRPDGG
jgi:hypothetical protein